MNKYITIILTTLLAALCPASAFSAESASDVIKRAADKLRAAKSVTATYTTTAGSHTGKGSITISGDKFHISQPDDVTVWYDGRTQWSYSPATGEVNIIEPTPEEIAQINPFAIIGAFSRGYKASMLKAPAGQKKVQLSATSRKFEIAKVTVTLDSSLLPRQLSLTTNDGKALKVNVTSIKLGGKVSASTFKFDKKKFPKARVVDLR